MSGQIKKVRKKLQSLELPPKKKAKIKRLEYLFSQFEKYPKIDLSASEMLGGIVEMFEAELASWSDEKSDFLREYFIDEIPLQAQQYLDMKKIKLTESRRAKPSDITAMAVSHTHPDHIGNIEMFPTTMLYVQKAEYEWPGANGEPRFKPAHPVTTLEGDHDVFGDGSVIILSTPGHTPGHQSLLVKLPNTGAVVLTGDAVHFKSNWDNRRVPVNNFSKDQTLASMQKLSDILTTEKAQLWINHDKVQRDGLKMSPEFYD